MRYISIDIETTGLKAGVNQMIEFAAVIDDMKGVLSEKPTFHRLIKHDRYVFDHDLFLKFPGHIELIKSMDDPANSHLVTTPSRIREEFYTWLLDEDMTRWDESRRKQTSFVCAGKNFTTFDLDFLKAYDFHHLMEFGHRMIDVGSTCFPFIKNYDEWGKPPSMQECCQLVGLDYRNDHRALSDAKMVCELLRKCHSLIND